MMCGAMCTESADTKADTLTGTGPQRQTFSSPFSPVGSSKLVSGNAMAYGPAFCHALLHLCTVGVRDAGV